MRKKIIFFHPYSVYGGADLSISKLIDTTPNEYEIDFLTFSKNPKIRFYTKRKMKIKRIKKINFIFSIFELRKLLKKELRIFDKIILLSNQNFANILALISSINLKKIKNISFERNHISEFDHSDKRITFFKNIIIKFLIKICYRYSDILIGNSKELCKDLQKYCDKKVLNLYNFYKFNEIRKKSNLKKKNIKFKNNIIINVGRLVDQKNQILLLKSFKILNKKNRKINLLLIGDGNKKKDFKNYIIKNKLNRNVQIISGVKNSLPYIKKADLYVSTSKYEGFPNVIIESLTLNVPIISTYYKSGLTEIIFNGKGGDLIKNNDPSKIAKRILLFFSKKSFLMKKTVLSQKKLQRFNYEIGRKNFQKIINKL